MQFNIQFVSLADISLIKIMPFQGTSNEPDLKYYILGVMYSQMNQHVA